jgi:hypothetical protein
MSNKAKPAQKQAILDAWTEKLGGPLADLAKLVGEVKGVYDVPIQYKLSKGKGTIKVGDKLEATMAPYADAKGKATTISNTIFTTIPGSPAYVSKATYHKVQIPEHGMEWTFENRNAIEGAFRFAASIFWWHRWPTHARPGGSPPHLISNSRRLRCRSMVTRKCPRTSPPRMPSRAGAPGSRSYTPTSMSSTARLPRPSDRRRV